MQRILLTALASFALSLLLGPLFMRWLHKLKFGQTIYDLGPESHKKKQGTPTMGGVIFAVPSLIAACAFSQAQGRFDFLLMALLSALGFGLVGFVDDYIKVKLKRSLGLTPKQKLIPQIVIALGLSAWAAFNPNIGTGLIVPFANTVWDLGWAYIPIMTFILVGTVNSANLLDGLDGLCGGCSLIDFAFFTVVCGLMSSRDTANAGNLTNLAVLCAALVGGIMGFLRYNGHPAQVFMGDVGSFYLGGALVGVAMVTRCALFLPLVALAMFLSSLSDIIQFSYFRATHGKRIFRMAPLHHHFELGGMPETKIVTMYRLGTAAMCMLALLSFH